LEQQAKIRLIEEEKQRMVFKSLEFITGDSKEAKIMRLGRSTHASKAKRNNKAQYIFLFTS